MQPVKEHHMNKMFNTSIWDELSAADPYGYDPPDDEDVYDAITDKEDRDYDRYRDEGF